MNMIIVPPPPPHPSPQKANKQKPIIINNWIKTDYLKLIPFSSVNFELLQIMLVKNFENTDLYDLTM